ncbi:MAG: hypothetical protein KDB07_10330 [Planctomycetes bacterium]|nr:hypothetical protein [Planctomycetota bacterium]
MNFPDGGTALIDESFRHEDLTAFGITLPEGEEVAEVYWWRSDAAQEEGDDDPPTLEDPSSLEEVKQHFAIETIESSPFEKHEGHKYHFALTPSKETHFYFASELYAPVCVRVGTTPQIYHLSLDQRWS